MIVRPELSVFSENAALQEFAPPDITAQTLGYAALFHNQEQRGDSGNGDRKRTASEIAAEQLRREDLAKKIHGIISKRFRRNQQKSPGE